MVIDINNENYMEIMNNKGLVLVDIWANWCMPCKNLMPIFEELSNENKDVQFLKANTKDCSILISQFRIMSVPSIVILKDGKQIDLLVGVKGKDYYQGMINDYL